MVLRIHKDNGNLKPERIAALKEQHCLENMTQYTVIAILNDAFRKECGQESKFQKRSCQVFSGRLSASKCSDYYGTVGKMEVGAGGTEWHLIGIENRCRTI